MAKVPIRYEQPRFRNLLGRYMTTRLRLTAVLDLCVRLLLALLALGVITMTLSSSKASAAVGGSSGLGNVVLLHGASAERDRRAIAMGLPPVRGICLNPIQRHTFRDDTTCTAACLE